MTMGNVLKGVFQFLFGIAGMAVTSYILPTLLGILEDAGMPTQTTGVFWAGLILIYIIVGVIVPVSTILKKDD